MNETPISLLKAKIKITCATCGCSMKRAKSFKVAASNAANAVDGCREQITKWKESLKGQNCRVCQSIINSI